MTRLAVWLAFTMVCTGCAAPQTLYSWGSYEDLIYASYAQPGSVPPEQQIEALERDYQAALAENKRVPPGWHAHLATLYYQLGKVEEAQKALLTEKAEYPESAVFVDYLLVNIRRPGAHTP